MEIKTVGIDKIRPYENNPRDNSKAVAQVQKSIEQFGWRQPIVVDENGVIVCGHTRYQAAQAMGLEAVPVHYAKDLTPEQVRAYRLADNRTAEWAEWDMDMLRVELGTLADEGFDIGGLGFSEREITKMLDPGASGGNTDPDETPVPDADSVVQPGQLWALGDHRLMCGDATDLDDVGRLMGGEKGHLIITDPPYNVAYEGKTKDALTIENDSMGDEDFYAFLLASFEAMASAVTPGSAIYVFHADSEGLNFRRALVDGGFLMKQCCVWVKNSMVMGRQDFHWQHEPVLYGWKEGGPHRWQGDRSQTTVWELDVQESQKEAESKWRAELAQSTVWRFNRPTANKEHPTMKPVKLIQYPMECSSKRGETVVDLFGGSGSTLIAAETLGRKCRTMELDARYCDVIIKRWEEFTGQKASLISTKEAS